MSNLYLKYGAIEGSATHDTVIKQIQIDSYQFSVGRPMGSPSGSVSKRDAGHPNLSEVNISKMMDASSVQLFGEACDGKAVPKVTITHLRATQPGGAPEPLLTIEMDDCMVSQYSIVASADQNPSESVSLNFTKIKFIHHPMKADGTKEGDDPYGWDLALNKKL